MSSRLTCACSTGGTRLLLPFLYMANQSDQIMCHIATPKMLMQYKLALCLYKLYNVQFNPFEFTLLNFNQILTERQTNFISQKSNSFKVGINSLANRLPHN